MTKPLEDMTPFERVEHELSLIEWGDDLHPEHGCPSCGRRAWPGEPPPFHALGCSIRNIRDQMIAIPEIYFS